MENVKKSRTKQILMVMHIIAWLAFVGFCIEGSAVIVTYVVSVFNPEWTKNLYNGLELDDLRKFDFWHYTLAAFFIASVLVMKAIASYLTIRVLLDVNIANPFTRKVASLLQSISYVLLVTWIIAMLNNLHTSWLLEQTGQLMVEWISGEFILVAGLVFVISQIFKRGVELQSENDLTV